MKIYTVGGAVRDAMLGLAVKDRDYVVVGETPETMVALGYTPVGKDFPVFLHPHTHEEYALARTERKTAPGYKGFVFHAAGDVTLEQDLARRDLTINAIARADDGTLVDPYGGCADLSRKLFRHVSEAFAEDPVRILRVARFAARFSDFSVAPETNLLMQHMVATGEVDALVPERVWQELARGLMEQQPSRMLQVLRDCDALARLLPEVDGDGPVMAMLDHAAQQGLTLPVRVAVLLHDPVGGDAATRMQRVDAVAARLKMPGECRDLAVMVARDGAGVVAAPGWSADAIVGLIERCDGLRKPQRFGDMLSAVRCIVEGGSAYSGHVFAPAALLVTALEAARGVPAGEIAAALGARPQAIAQAIRIARIEAVARSIGAISRIAAAPQQDN
ncbi:multifunctional CCA tRNA nucleotidyl transferase/2'3'-cyclic phosphodiesterase/2'nucleotidase/phosphatase [Actimicrobium sp. CCI2.3]|uniref:multifunctional CCA tRNA nucleotidyl transferase/2'3'-cyclic phosphodiesterase/2'nucleotidase/phosphatase n=1 Tax=Actimicrobium sp. CCI2.3 TaxID=3048616 RepID=UPI002AB44BC8|nr:multifunctional CCA tRNA nucleotidyl transferase/2'3'-cyclic phosphodiesterase/2'nucleotidase/phosphatase [Actimicrobium sp. CCI2.3]MDY7576342.1 multifunctional CCA tRNA nucleotidyl transferase/2'3'-cyclic phosphodiesterase/2'nucleotidase/phosphatase [Actimicrobium sp. CCI2.3]MEB0020454.1 multifunctional CCA tRNA nucleotidyl transferase/2'3'-cyclic phosphodiesterase/2'nucleotidase/phosphatase [Actimicrobium sp. CCI2.3]